MKKKTVKKLVLSKETVRGLDLELVVGATNDVTSRDTRCEPSAGPLQCDPPVTGYPTCID